MGKDPSGANGGPQQGPPSPEERPRLGERLRRALVGAPRDIEDPHTYHAISLVAFLAWVGLGADGLSSSSYGPDEAYRALGTHTHLAVGLALATALTVIIIATAYSRIIERFPFGGGGYVVASHLLGPRWGVVSGSALLVDYVLTISVSIASGADAIFSFLPASTYPWKLPIEAMAIVLLVVLNLRGVRESVTILTPVFGLFLVTHAVLIFGGVGSHLPQVPSVAREVGTGFREGLAQVGALGLFAIFLKAYSMGGGTYTGIEAVSNGIQIMREPKVQTAKRTMVLMAVSLSVTAGGILLCYLLFRAVPEEGKTMNAVLLENFAGHFRPWGLPIGSTFVIVTLISEAALLFVAAQAGFIDGPRVMANMATDSWWPHRFAQLSARLTIKDGVLLMGGASLVTLFYTRGNITALVTMYSINVFVTFSLSQASMVRLWISKKEPGRRRGLVVHGVALALCLAILGGTIYEKGEEGGWVTIAVTALVVGLCFVIHRHYEGVQENLRRLDSIMAALPQRAPASSLAVDPNAPTAVLLVGGYGGLGIHALLSVQRTFAGHFKNVLFVGVGVIDSAAMKGVEEVDRVRLRTDQALQQYVALAHRLGIPADYRMAVGTEAVAEAEKLCAAIAKEFPRAVFFAGKLVFERERWYQRFLHNETAYQIQRRLQFAGMNAMVLPVRILEGAGEAASA
ncbi:MAG TPA: APC family permease [Anaeromyxobacteraceae bacterium]|nr:APC family permease [Anaeromyxobacteraceae bacterium]